VSGNGSCDVMFPCLYSFTLLSPSLPLLFFVDWDVSYILVVVGKTFADCLLVNNLCAELWTLLPKAEGYRFGVVRPAVRPSGCPSVRHKLVGGISQRLLQL